MVLLLIAIFFLRIKENFPDNYCCNKYNIKVELGICWIFGNFPKCREGRAGKVNIRDAGCLWLDCTWKNLYPVMKKFSAIVKCWWPSVVSYTHKGAWDQHVTLNQTFTYRPLLLKFRSFGQHVSADTMLRN